MKNKLRFGIAIVGLIGVASLAACGGMGEEMYYKGELRPVTEVEEIIADELEVENPGMDLEVNIYTEED